MMFTRCAWLAVVLAALFAAAPALAGEGEPAGAVGPAPAVSGSVDGDGRKEPVVYRAIVGWLHLFDTGGEGDAESRGAAFVRAAVEMPGHLAGTFRRLGDGSGSGSAFFTVFAVFLACGGGSLAVLLFRLLTPHFHDRARAQEIPELGGYMRFWAGLIRLISGLADLAVFGAAALAAFFLTPLMEVEGGRYFFLAALLAILLIRLGAMLSHLLCSPAVSGLRVLALSDATAVTAHRIMVAIFAYVALSFIFIALVSELGMAPEAVAVLVVFLGSLLLLAAGILLLANRRAVALYIMAAETVDTGGAWVLRRFAGLWHIPALLYLLFVWMIFVHHQVMAIRLERQAFLLSLLVVPLFLVLDRMAHWVVETTIAILKIYQDPEDAGDAGEPELPSAEEREKLLVVKVFRVVRVALLLALLGWVLHIWGYTLPYLNVLTEIVFRSLVIMALALLFWHIVSEYIERRLLEEEGDEPVEEDQDSEWGGGAIRGRAYTLLPMVRKFIGTVLVIMVTLTILSTVGIEIGPLLAGAGVVGLAIGFGAQKLVSDIFSGFFFLLDDAFRVGEYLEAGGVSGAVEGITLRNILLRHHRGMLQIVPYSELGPITNYMRGGIVVKFNLEFPYDTDIDLVRKVIKKVGQAMLEDEELGKDFIRPVKSQGVREITNSVMVIRVKFTAQPGTHFVIRREAYRRITEALAAKGIYYAHRKVIVELPQEIRDAEEAERKRLAEAGAAAALAAESQEGHSPSGGG